MSVYVSNTYPASGGSTVPQDCASNGHASYTQDGRHQGYCARCGAPLPIPAAHLRPGHVIRIMGSEVTVDAVTMAGMNHVAVHYGGGQAWLLSNDAPMRVY